jgi:DNA (cytosine-5)-methyltransferase 1
MEGTMHRTLTQLLPSPGSYRLRSVSPFSEKTWKATPSGLILPASAVVPERQRKPTGISFFTGAGGFDLGFQEAGFYILAASDNSPECAWTYCYNLGARPVQFHFVEPRDRERFIKCVVKESHGKVFLDEQDYAFFERAKSYERDDNTPHFFLGDVRRLSGKQVLDAVGLKKGEVDVVFGGPPCQGFSRIGRRDVMDPRNSLIFEFARLILEIMPKSMVMENVPDIVSMVTPQGIPVVDAFCKILSEGNYASFQALKQALTNNPQARGVLKDQGKSKELVRKDLREATNDQGETGQLSLFGE